MTDATYTVAAADGLPMAAGVSLAEAVDLVLTHDGRQVMLRPAEDGEGHRLWERQQVAGRSWSYGGLFSLAAEADAAWDDIRARVLREHGAWRGYPRIRTDAEHAAMLAEAADA